MAKSAAVRRLERILFDTSPEEYGPKLTRLSVKDQAYILGRIERGENAQVTRKEILRLDKERLAQRRSRRAKPTQQPKTLDIVELRRRAYEQMHRQHRNKLKYDSANTRKRVSKYMSASDAEFAMNASDSELTESARATPYVSVPGSDDINPFWYH